MRSKGRHVAFSLHGPDAGSGWIEKPVQNSVAVWWPAYLEALGVKRGLHGRVAPFWGALEIVYKPDLHMWKTR